MRGAVSITIDQARGIERTEYARQSRVSRLVSNPQGFIPPRRRPRSSDYRFSEILGAFAVGLLITGIVGLGVYRLLTGLSFP